MGFDYGASTEGFPSDASGLVVSTAVDGTPARRAGFGDGRVLVTAVNGKQMDGSLPAYCDAVGNGGATGDSAVFTVIPEGQTQPQDVRVNFV
jgi:S1-C subfamily serine protease